MNAPSASDIAVVVACRDEERHLPVCVESLIASSRGRAELWFVDDGSTDGTSRILESFVPQIHLLRAGGEGPGRARNLAWRRSDRRFIAFLDADTRVPANWIDAMVAELATRDERIAAIGGAQDLYDGANEGERHGSGWLSLMGFVSDYLHQGDGAIRVRHNPSCNVVYDRAALLDVDGFDEAFWPCEDLDLDLRMGRKGWGMIYSPRMRVQHRRPESFWGLCRMMARYGFGHAKLVRKHGPCQPIHAMPIALPMIAVAHLALFKRHWVDLALIDAAVAAFFFGFLWARVRNFSTTMRYFLDTLGLVAAWNYGFYKAILRKSGKARPRG